MVSALPNKNSFRLGWHKVHEVVTKTMRVPQIPLGWRKAKISGVDYFFVLRLGSCSPIPLASPSGSPANLHSLRSYLRRLDMLNCDLLLINGVVIDGSGQARRQASIAVKDGRIVGVGGALNYAASKTIDLKGLAIAPGLSTSTHTTIVYCWPTLRWLQKSAKVPPPLSQAIVV